MKPRLVVCNLEYGVEQSKEMKKEYYVRVISEGVIGNIQVRFNLMRLCACHHGLYTCHDSILFHSIHCNRSCLTHTRD